MDELVGVLEILRVLVVFSDDVGSVVVVGGSVVIRIGFVKIDAYVVYVARCFLCFGVFIMTVSDADFLCIS